MSLRPVFFLLLSLFLLQGCAQHGYQDPELVASSECAALWSEFQQEVSAADVFEAQDWPLPKYPFLRIDRNSSFVARQGLSTEQQRQWLLQAYERGRFARVIENGKLPQPLELKPLETCLRSALPTLIDNDDFWDYVRTHPRPDAYVSARRQAGLFPLFQPIVSWRVDVLNEELMAAFQHYERDESATWKRYVLGSRPSWSQIQPILQQATHLDELEMPRFSIPETEQLLAYYSPVIEQEASHAQDRIGRPYRLNGHWGIRAPAELYTLVSATRWRGQWVPQLVYVWWYGGRPKSQPLDIYGGELDGLMWRVTLSWEGKVLFYDSVHPCGCYHKFYPAQPDITFAGNPKGEEALSVLPVVSPGTEYRPVVRLNSVQHFVVGLSFETTPQLQPGEGYQLVPYQVLREEPSGEDYLFGQDGLVEGTERLERFLLWNMGVVSPGAMRQWGQHATAFSSRRHFDDPELFERYFDAPEP